MAAEGFTRLTYEIVEGEGGVSRLTVIHELDGDADHAAMVAGELQDRAPAAAGCGPQRPQVAAGDGAPLTTEQVW